jgi:predicted small lipoprotein YifL
VTVRSSGTISRLALFAVLCGALGLAACGRKGGLDAPPAAYAEPNGTADAAPANPGTWRDGSATSLPVIRGQNKRIPLDVLLD